MPARRFVIGDIHGAHKALCECFEKASFNPDSDLLISLGDICDGWPEVNKVFDELLSVKNLVYILGNHDKWALDWFLYHDAPEIWTMQGGDVTISCYPYGVPHSHIRLLAEALLFYTLENKLFLHGGFDPDISIEKQDFNILLWDRKLVHNALNMNALNKNHHITGYDEVYVGHTPTINYGKRQPIFACEVIMMDTGAGWPGGVLTMMDIDSKHYVCSTPVNELYKGFRGRG
jgi:serine/threonine protein phosphatase 1